MKSNLRKSTLSLIQLTPLSACIFLLLATGISGQAADWWPFGKDKAETKENGNTAEVVINEAPVSRDTKLTTSFSGIIKQSSPAVVSIKTSSYIKNPRLNPLLREFFGIPEQPEEGRRLQPRGIGSGVIVSKDGYILTNNHVIAEADEILIDFPDETEKEYPATIVGTDPRSDLAVLKVEMEEQLQAATIGNSDQLEVGDIVLAIGNPFGLGQTVTMGIISATGRNQVIPPQSGVLYQDFIQTDASINQGNSGGALIDAEGRLIGINTAIFSRTGENLGIGFAVPINMARNVMEQLIEQGKVSRGYLGVNIDELDEDLAKSFGLDSKSGALVTFVEPDSPADQAGIESGDVILKINNREIKAVTDLLLTVSQQTPGTTVQAEVFRDGKRQTFDVVLTERPDETARSMEGAQPDSDEENEVAGKLFEGILVQDLTAEARKQLNAPESVNGALVTKVTPNTPAAEAGLRRGMVILEINANGKNRKIEDASDAVEFSKSLRANSARLYIWNSGAYRYLVLKDED